WYDGTGTYTSLKLGNTYYKLRITGAGTWTINADLTVSSIFYIAAGTFNASSYTINLTGSGTPFAVDGTFQEATSTVIYTGSSATNILGTTYKNLKLNHASTTFTSSGATTVSGVLTIQAGIFDASSQTITLSGSGTPFVVTDTFTPSTSTIKYTGTSTAAVAATTYNNLEFSPAGTSTYTLASGTLNTNGNFSLGTGAGSTTVNADTNDPIVNVDGNFLISTEGVYIASASAAFSVASNFTNSKTFTDSGGTLTLDGQGLQTFTATNTTANYDFQNLIITNNSVAGVEFVDSVKVNGTFTDTTASSKVTFHSTSTYTFNAISINGGSTSTRVTLTSSTPGSAWNLTIAAASPSASNVSVKDSTANKDVDATTGGYDATGNTHWLFPVANNAPTNDTLIFINPYSSNIAVADDTIEWNFRALVTDLDGPTNLNYVELRLANLADSTQPYDSLKFRWTESTDTFSETADTQNAATLTSTSADSNASGNQWQLDFKIKFNSSFATTSTNYAAELYSLDDASASDNDNYVDIYQVQNLSLTFSVDSNTLAFGSLLPGSVLTGTTQTTVTTNYPNGYSLAASDGSDTNSALAQGGTYVADYASTITTPTAWSSGTGLGICLFSATGKNTTQWGTGTTETDSNNKYAGVPQNATTIHSKTGSPTLSDLSKIGYKLVVPDTQKTGAYSGIITYTVTGALN
ncbi:MAG: hypothetical protein NTY30_00355, partial [Candidatus Berkelbacteria bacterium]|nr:hypothetical protein [Candidatus Berkelbacteria bacterium]